MTPKCDKCSKETNVSDGFNMHLPEEEWLHDNGLVLTVDGYYDGFVDNYDTEPIKLLLCHDCSLEFWTQIPKLNDLYPRGLHPKKSDNEDFCCKYAWTFDEETEHVVYPDGTKERCGQ